MRLSAALGTVLLSTGGSTTGTARAFQHARDLAETLGQPEYRLRSLYGLWVHALHQNDYRAAYAAAESFSAVATRHGDAEDVQVADRLLGTTEHYLGRQAAARSRLAGWLALPSGGQRSREARFGVDQRVAALTILARVLALQADPDRALQVAQTAIDAAHGLERAVSLCHALGEHCVIALWTSTPGVLAQTAAALETTATRHGLRFWRPHVLVAQAALARGQRHAGKAAALFDAAVRTVGADQFDLAYPSLITVTAEGLSDLQPGAARTMVDQALGRADAMERWYTPALLVARGTLALKMEGAAATASAQADFRAALSQAERQSAPLLAAQAAAALAALLRQAPPAPA